MRRLLARALVLATVPVALTVAPQSAEPAAAARSYGSAVQFTMNFNAEEDDGGLTDQRLPVTCNGAASYWVNNDPISQGVKGRIRCAAENPVYGTVDALVATTYISPRGTTGSGAPCVGESQTFEDPIAGLSFDTTLGGSGVTDCIVYEICMVGAWEDEYTVTFDIHYMVDTCVTVDLGPIPEVHPQCPYGRPTLVTALPKPDPDSGNHARHYEITFAGAPQGSTLRTPGQPWKYWRVHARIPDVTGTKPDITTSGVWRIEHTETSTATGAKWVDDFHWRNRDAFGAGNGYPAPVKYPFGVWIWARSSDFTGHAPGLLKGVGGSVNNYTLDTDWGKNDPANCIFYFGPAFFDDPNSDLDDPSGEMNGEPTDPVDEEPELEPEPPTPPPTSSCKFSIKDPSTWMGGALCALVGLVQELIDAIEGLVSAILDGLRELFIPSGDYDFAGLLQQVKSKPPFSLLTSLGNEAMDVAAAYQSGGNCGSLFPNVAGESVTCTDVSSAPGISGLYSLVAAGLVSLTLWAMFVMIARLFEEGQ